MASDIWKPNSEMRSLVTIWTDQVFGSAVRHANFLFSAFSSHSCNRGSSIKPQSAEIKPLFFGCLSRFWRFPEWNLPVHGVISCCEFLHALKGYCQYCGHFRSYGMIVHRFIHAPLAVSVLGITMHHFILGWFVWHESTRSVRTCHHHCTRSWPEDRLQET